jgi:hypothetical protein
MNDKVLEGNGCLHKLNVNFKIGPTHSFSIMHQQWKHDANENVP